MIYTIINEQLSTIVDIYLSENHLKATLERVITTYGSRHFLKINSDEMNNNVIAMTYNSRHFPKINFHHT